jgi:hypothetical protein
MAQPSPTIDKAVGNEGETVALVTPDGGLDDEEMVELVEGPPAHDETADNEGEAVAPVPTEVSSLLEESFAIAEIVGNEGEPVASVPTEISSDEKMAALAEGSVDFDTASNGGEDMDLADSVASDLDIKPFTQEKIVTGDDHMPISHPSPGAEGTPSSQRALRHLTPIQPALSFVYRSEPTTPILHADPYPYCLSTPGASLHVLEEESQDEDTESFSEEDNDHSSCSSTAKNEMETEEGDQIIPVDVDGSEFELLYPSEDAEGECEGREVPGVAEDQQASHSQQHNEEGIDTVISPQDQSVDGNDRVKIVTDQETNGGLLDVAPIDGGPTQAGTGDIVTR